MATIGAGAVQRLRESRGLSQRVLAQTAGVSRQAVGAIESGRMQPTVQIALALARALETTVETLFAKHLEPARLTRVATATIAGRRVEHPLEREHLGVEPAGGPMATAFIAGCDPALGLLARVASERSREIRVLWLPMTNRAALGALARGRVHAAVTHAPAGKRVPGAEVAAFELATTEQGWCVAHGNPLGLRGARDLARARARLANRPPGAGARALLDAELRRASVVPRDVRGYEGIHPSQLDAARAVADGLADAAVGAACAARLFGLGFLPLREERLSLLARRPEVDSRELRLVIETLSSERYRSELLAFAAYDVTRTGLEVA